LAFCSSAIVICLATASAVTPSEQRAIVQTGTGGPEILKLQVVPVPEPGANQILVRVYAAAVNPTDWKSRAGTPGYQASTAAIIPGGDIAGVVERLGAGVSMFKAGDAVFAVVVRKPEILNGAFAQFAVVAVGTAVAKPRGMTFAEASGLGIATVTAVRAVNETRVAKGQRVLITGVAGGVGSAAAQAAKARGAYVIGTASARHNAYLKTIGVDEVIDYTQVKFEERVKNVDAVIDTVGEDTADRAMLTLKMGGMYISVGARGLEGKCAAAGIQCVGRSSAGDLPRNIYEEAGSLAAAGKLKVAVDKTFPLEQAAQAQVYGAEGHTQGKIVLIVDAAHANRK
jgi:NADPH:quinone reductase-like Zn-dependent oxidoreductase